MKWPINNNILKSLFVIVVISLISIIGYKFLKYKSIKRMEMIEEIKIGFAGDTMLGRLVNKKISETNYAYPWGNILPTLKTANIIIVNLETTLTKSEKKVPKVFNFKATPDKVETLKIAGIDVVNLANNHMLDFLDEGLVETVSTLDKAKIKHVGAGKNTDEAKRAVIIEKNGIKVGVIGYADYPNEWKAQKNKPGTNVIKIGDIEKIKNDIKNVRPQVDLLIATIHWGPNMRERPTTEFKEFAHQMIDAGIDIIHGHSAHIFQGIEIYKNKFILYDTGDFVDDYAVDPVLRNDRSFFYIVTVDKSGIKNLQLIPLLISNMQVNLATGEDKKESLERIKKLSAEFGTKIEEDKIIIAR